MPRALYLRHCATLAMNRSVLLGRLAVVLIAVLAAPCKGQHAVAVTAPTGVPTAIDAAVLNGPHTIAVRYLPQFEAVSLAPMVSVSSGDDYWLAIAEEKIQLNLRGSFCEFDLFRPVRWDGPSVPVPRWRHLAVTVDAARAARVYQDGLPVAVGCCKRAGRSPVTGTLLLGRREMVDDIQPQFYGLLDDVVLYNRVLNAGDVMSLRVGIVPAGSIANLDFEGPGAPPGVAAISRNHDAINDRRSFLPPRLTFNNLPFPNGDVWRVIQAWNNGNGSHSGQAAFSLDLAWVSPSDVRAHRNTSQAQTQGRMVTAVHTATIDETSDGSPPCISNYVRLRIDPDVFVIYHHLTNVLPVMNGSVIAAQTPLGFAGDTGLKETDGCPPNVCCPRLLDDHLHFAVAKTHPRPYVFASYQMSTDQGRNWRPVSNDFPYRGQWIRATPANPFPRCQTPDTCPAGNFCIASRCIPAPRHCTKNSDCGPSALCSKGTCALY